MTLETALVLALLVAAVAWLVWRGLKPSKKPKVLPPPDLVEYRNAAGRAEYERQKAERESTGSEP